MILIGLVSLGHADNFELVKEISPEVWAVRENPGEGIFDAVILKHHTRIGTEKIDYYRMIRILTEDGKRAAEQFTLSPHLIALNGRVTDISGDEILFDQDSDMVEVFGYRDHRSSGRLNLVIPPGLTPDCVVEISWSVSAEKGLPKDSYFEHYQIPEPWFCVEKKYMFSMDSLAKFSNSLFSDSIIDIVTRFYWTDARPPVTFLQSVLDNHTVLTYRNVPPMTPHPFGDRFQDPNMASFFVFRTLPFEGHTVKSFWNAFGNSWIRLIFGFPFDRSPKYREWISELKGSLPDKGAKGVRFVHNRFKQHFTAIDMMTPGQLRTAKKSDLEDQAFNRELLSRSFERGFVMRGFMPIALFRVLRDCGFPVSLLFAPPVDGIPFQPRELNPFGLNLDDALIGLPLENNRWVTIAPAHPEYMSGAIPPHFRGVPLYVVTPGTNWDHKIVRLPRLGWKANRTTYQYILEILPNGAMQFRLKEEGAGIFDATNRLRYHALNRDARIDVLSNSWSQKLPEWRIQKVSVGDTRNWKQKVTLMIQGVSALDIEALDWVAIKPFPGAESMLTIPETWPENRKQPIVLPHAMGQLASCRLKLPEGWYLKGDPSWTKKNSVGEISIQAKTTGNGIVVQRKITITDSEFSADKEKDLKTFIAWMSDVLEQTIAIGIK